MKRATLAVCGLLLLTVTFCCAQQSTNPSTAPPASPPPVSPPSVSSPNAEFLQAADEVLAQMSKLLSLPVLEPLKKSVRSREQIRDYLIAQAKEDKDQAKRYADQKTLEALGLIPKGYPLEQKLLTLLTEQIAGLYDPKSREFFIADWTNPADQRVIMAHELTHALQDQHFHVEKWEDAAKPNDDAELARDSVLEGSATVAMIDYLLRDSPTNSLKMEDLDPSLLMGDPKDSPELADAPMILQDEMLFPYLPGSTFVQHVLKAWNGWPDIHKIFENPPKSTQQILHPDLYLKGVAPVPVDLAFDHVVPREWKKLDENVLGEFGVNEILKQFLGKERADDLAPGWAGDRYAIFERKPGGPTLLIIRSHFASDTAAARFFGGYSETLEIKDKERTNLFRRPNFFSFDSPDGGVFIRCFGSECLSAEGTSRKIFDEMTRELHWPEGPAEPRPAGAPSQVASLGSSAVRVNVGVASPRSTPTGSVSASLR